MELMELIEPMELKESMELMELMKPMELVELMEQNFRFHGISGFMEL